MMALVGMNQYSPNQREFQGSDLLISPYVSLTAAHVVSNDQILGDVTPSFLYLILAPFQMVLGVIIIFLDP